MDPRLQEALNGPAKIISRLFSGSMVKRMAFFRRKLKKIYQSGIRAVCVESRPHEGFCGPSWVGGYGPDPS